MSVTLSSGLTLVLPDPGDQNWYNSIKTLCFQKVSEHDHTGGGKGKQITADAIAGDALNDTKIRLRNNQWLRARNAADNADVNILKINASNALELNVSIDGTSLSDNSVNDAKVRLRNDQYLRARNAAGSADIDILKITSSNTLQFGLSFSGTYISAATIPTTALGGLSNNQLLGRGSGVSVTAISPSGGLEFFGSTTFQIADLGVTTAKINDLAVTTGKLASYAVDDTKFKLRNNQFLRARNAADSADVTILKINASDALEFAVNINGSSITDDTLTDAKVRIRNNQYLRGRNQADNADINLMGLNTSNELLIGSASSIIKIGNITNTECYINLGSSADITMNIPSGEQFKITEAGTTKIAYIGGVLRSPSGQTVSLGDNSNPWTNMFVTGYHQFADGSAPATPSSGFIRLYSESGVLKYKDSTGTVKTITTT